MKTILVIDDNQDFLEMVRYVLSQEGFRVFTASDGRQGVLQVHHERPDLILMDVMMPGHDGVETAGYLQAIGRFTGIPVVFLTGIVSEDGPEGGDTVRIDGREYPRIMKTVGQKELVLRVKGYLSDAQRKVLNVLVVEDSPTDAHLIVRSLEKSSRRTFNVARAASLHEAEEYCYANQVDVIVQDLALPDSQKKDTLLWMLKQQYPIVVITGDENEETVSEAFRHGAQDYLVKGDFSDREVVRCVMYAVERVMIRKELLLYKTNIERVVQERVNEILAAAKKINDEKKA
jgi:DNA-binding response OmpR family regulator